MHNTMNIGIGGGHNRGDSISSHSRVNPNPSQTYNPSQLNQNLSSAFGRRNGSVSVNDKLSINSKLPNTLDLRSKPSSKLGSDYAPSPINGTRIKKFKK